MFGRVAKSLWKKRGISKGGGGTAMTSGMLNVKELRDKNAEKITIFDNEV